MGFGVIEAGRQPKLVDAGVIRTKVHQAEPERLKAIYEGLTEIIAATRPQVMSIEKLFFLRNVTTAMSVAQARGVALLVAEQHGLTIAEYTPLQIKQALTGYGKADKAQVQEMVRVLLGLKTAPKPDDCADALAAALTYRSLAYI